MTATLPTPDLYVPGNGPHTPMTPAAQSWSYRLQEAADLAQSVSSRLADLAVRYPQPPALRTLRNIEDSLDVLSRIWLANLDQQAPADDLAGYDHRQGSDEDYIDEPRPVPMHTNDPEHP
jgi:hypothetical protein